MKQKIKQYKWVFIVGGCALVLFALYLLFKGVAGPAKPGETTDVRQPGQTEDVFDSSKFFFVSASPPSGNRQTADSFEYIRFTFSKDIDLGTVDVKVDPYIALRTRVYDKNPRVLVLQPASPWVPNAEYKIVIDKTLSSADGRSLAEDVEYVYFNTLPASIDAGENFFK